MLEPDYFLPYRRISAATRNFTWGKSAVYVLAVARHGFKMVLFTDRAVETPSALLVSIVGFQFSRSECGLISLVYTLSSMHVC